ncbi:hypothetical protein V2J09_019562 [Rumex salicifolius]
MGRTPCCDKEAGMKKGPWTPEEDQKLVDYINIHGHRNWRTLPKNAGLQRCGKSCRLRWTNYLRPDIKRGRFSFEEEETIINLHSILGNKWSAIATRLPGRTDNEIKNYWNTHIRKRLLRMGIDPVTHSPRLDLLDLSSILQNQSLYNNNANISSLFGLVNPDILKIATSLFSMQNQQPIDQIPTSSQLQNQFNTTNTMAQQPCMNSNDWVPFSSLDTTNDYGQLYSSNVDVAELGFDSQGLSQLMNAWECNETAAENLPGLSNSDLIQQNGCLENYNVGIYDSDKSKFQSDKNGFSFSSMLSTPSSSSPTPLNSNSVSAGIATEDERESYCSNLIKFEIPANHILDVNEFM